MNAEAAPTLFALVGVTASGKSAVALEVAARAGAAILSLDSMQVYRGMDVGTAKPDAAERARVPHFLLDLADPDERYDVTRFLADAEAAERAVRDAGRRPLYAGGTGFYLKALTHGLFEGPDVDPELRARLEARARAEGLERTHARLAAVDPEAAARIHANDLRRVVRALEVLEQTGRTLSDWQAQWLSDPEPGEEAGRERPGRPRVLVGLEPDPEQHEARIAARVEAMLAEGWTEEARRVREGPGFGPTAIQALGYRDVLRHVDGELDRDALVELVALRTRQFARRQRTWFRRFPEIRWIAAPGAERSVEQVAAEVLAALGWAS